MLFRSLLRSNGYANRSPRCSSNETTHNRPASCGNNTHETAPTCEQGTPRPTVQSFRTRSTRLRLGEPRHTLLALQTHPSRTPTRLARRPHCRRRPTRPTVALRTRATSGQLAPARMRRMQPARWRTPNQHHDEPTRHQPHMVTFSFHRQPSHMNYQRHQTASHQPADHAACITAGQRPCGFLGTTTVPTQIGRAHV